MSQEAAGLRLSTVADCRHFAAETGLPSVLESVLKQL